MSCIIRRLAIVITTAALPLAFVTAISPGVGYAVECGAGTVFDPPTEHLRGGTTAAASAAGVERRYHAVLLDRHLRADSGCLHLRWYLRKRTASPDSMRRAQLNVVEVSLRSASDPFLDEPSLREEKRTSNDQDPYRRHRRRLHVRPGRPRRDRRLGGLSRLWQRATYTYCAYTSAPAAACSQVGTPPT
jgi:hypothetical protein